MICWQKHISGRVKNVSKKEQKTAEKSVAGPLRKHRTRTEKIDDLKKQISDLRKAEREERQKARDEKLLAIGKAVYEKAEAKEYLWLATVCGIRRI